MKFCANEPSRTKRHYASWRPHESCVNVGEHNRPIACVARRSRDLHTIIAAVADD